MPVGLLGLQGAFLDHVPTLHRLGVQTQIVRTPDDLTRVDRLILPGGESSVMAKYIHELGLLTPLRQRISSGMPVWGICAGSILLATTVDDRPGVLRCLSVTVQRNAYGRQLASTFAYIDAGRLGVFEFPAIFIRAPKITAVGQDVEILARWQDDPVFVQRGNLMATTFHPELTQDPVFHQFFLALG
jgi:5'-phosphate synthase pdxT subunit